MFRVQYRGFCLLFFWRHTSQAPRILLGFVSLVVLLDTLEGASSTDNIGGNKAERPRKGLAWRGARFASEAGQGPFPHARVGKWGRTAKPVDFPTPIPELWGQTQGSFNFHQDPEAGRVLLMERASDNMRTPQSAQSSWAITLVTQSLMGLLLNYHPNVF